MNTTDASARTGRKKKNAGKCVFVENNSGFLSDSAPCLEAGNSGTERPNEPAPPAWMSPELIERTHSLWAKNFGRSLERCEVLEILRNVRWFGDILRQWMAERRTT